MPLIEVPPPAIKGTYGTIFATGPKVESDFNALAKRLYEDSVREGIPPPHPAAWDAYVKQRGSLYQAGSETPLVVQSLINEEHAINNPTFEGSLGVSGVTSLPRGSYPSPPPAEADDKETRRRAVERLREEQPPTWWTAQHQAAPAHLSVSGPQALLLADRLPGGGFHVPLLREPYRAPLRAEKHPHGSAHLTSTPKMWPLGEGHGQASSSSSVVGSRHRHSAPQDDEATLGTASVSLLSHGGSASHASLACSKSQHRSSGQGGGGADDLSLGSLSASLAYPAHRTAAHRGNGSNALYGGYLDKAPREANASLLMQAVDACSRLVSLDSNVTADSGRARKKGTRNRADNASGKSNGKSNSKSNGVPGAGPTAAAALDGAVASALERERQAMRVHAHWLQNHASLTGSHAACSAGLGQGQGQGRAEGRGRDDGSVASAVSQLSQLSLEEPFDMRSAGLTYSQRHAKTQQASLQATAARATQALGEHKYKRAHAHASSSPDPASSGGGPDEDEERAEMRRGRLKRSSLQTSPSHKAPPTPRGLSTGTTPKQSQLLHSNCSPSLAATTYDRLHYSRYGQQLVEHLGAAAGVSAYPDAASASASSASSSASASASASAASSARGAAEGVPRNPFRPTRRREMSLTRTSAQTLNPLDPLAYRPSARVLACGGVTVVVRPDKTLGGAVPTQDEVFEALGRVTRRAVLAFDTRIVETGALSKALGNPALPAPGMAAALALHRAFVSAAALNPNPWQLGRGQLLQVLRNTVPWLTDAAASRLVSAYDSTASGVLRFVRLSSALCCCCSPGLAVLVTTLERGGEERGARARAQRDREAMRLRLLNRKAEAGLGSALGTGLGGGGGGGGGVGGEGGGGGGGGEGGAGEGEADDGLSPLERAEQQRERREHDREHAAELFLLKIVHGLYETCEGGDGDGGGGDGGDGGDGAGGGGGVLRNERGQGRALGAAGGPGMRLEDVAEALSCCAASVEDEVAMAGAAQPLVQDLFHQAQRRDDTLNQAMLPREPPSSHSHSHIHGHGHARSTDDASLSSAASHLSSNFTALSRFTPHSAPHTPHTPHTPHKTSSFIPPQASAASFAQARASAAAAAARGAVGALAATAQQRARLDRQASRAAEAWRQSRGLGRDGVHLSSASVFTASASVDSAGRGGSLAAGWVHGAGAGSPPQSVLRGGESVAWRSDGGGEGDADDASLLSGPSLAASRARGSVGVRVGGASSLSEGGPSRLLPSGRLAADVLLTHAVLKSSARIPRVSQPDLIAALLRHPQCLGEFVRQLARFRALTQPYSIHGSVSFSEAKAHPEVPYGSKA